MTHETSDETLSRCVIDVVSRKVYIYSNQGNERVVDCEDMNEFMNVLDFVRSQLDESMLFYSEPF